METAIPFNGFYESEHDHELDRALEQMAQDDHGDPVTLYDEDGEELYLWDHVDWKKVHVEYSKLYVEAYNWYYKSQSGIDLKLKFVEMTSPREYNFTTDRIFCKISYRAVKQVYDFLGKEAVEKSIKETFTSYDGFCSYYSNRIEDWPKLREWDHNQVYVLLRTLPDKWEIMEDCNNNSELDDILYDALDAEGKQALKKYWDQRAAKEYFDSHQLKLQLKGTVSV